MELHEVEAVDAKVVAAPVHPAAERLRRVERGVQGGATAHLRAWLPLADAFAPDCGWLKRRESRSRQLSQRRRCRPYCPSVAPNTVGRSTLEPRVSWGLDGAATTARKRDQAAFTAMTEALAPVPSGESPCGGEHDAPVREVDLGIPLVVFAQTRTRNPWPSPSCQSALAQLRGDWPDSTSRTTRTGKTVRGGLA